MQLNLKVFNIILQLLTNILFLGIVDRVRNDSVKNDENFQTRLKKLANVHAQLLNHALKSYPDLERLVYSTCSANVEENEAVVDEALSLNGNFKLLDVSKLIRGWKNKGVTGYDCSEKCLNAVPNFDCTNGFFIAVFVRRDFEEKDIDDKHESNMNESDMEIDNNSSVITKEEKSDNVLKCAKKIKKPSKNSVKLSKRSNTDITSQLNNNVDLDILPSVKTENLQWESKKTAKSNESKKNKEIKLPITSDVKSKNAKRRLRRAKLKQYIGKRKTH